jgi:isopenicillin N synthase-like dioxygenase
VTPHEHAKRIVENYIQVGLGDSHFVKHAVATAVAYLDLEQRLAAAEALADHVSFEHEVDMQTLEARLAVSNALLREAGDFMTPHSYADWKKKIVEHLEAKLTTAQTLLREVDANGPIIPCDLFARIERQVGDERAT